MRESSRCHPVDDLRMAVGGRTESYTPWTAKKKKAWTVRGTPPRRSRGTPAPPRCATRPTRNAGAPKARWTALPVGRAKRGGLRRRSAPPRIVPPRDAGRRRPGSTPPPPPPPRAPVGTAGTGGRSSAPPRSALHSPQAPGSPNPHPTGRAALLLSRQPRSCCHACPSVAGHALQIQSGVQKHRHPSPPAPPPPPKPKLSPSSVTQSARTSGRVVQYCAQWHRTSTTDTEGTNQSAPVSRPRGTRGRPAVSHPACRASTRRGHWDGPPVPLASPVAPPPLPPPARQTRTPPPPFPLVGWVCVDRFF